MSKAKISKRLRLPMLSGMLGGMVIGVVLALLVLDLMLGLSAGKAVLVFVVPAAVCLWQSLRRGAWVYSNMRKLHTAEYYYNLGNGAGFLKAVAGYEHRVQVAVIVWLRRTFGLDAVKIYLVAFMLCMVETGEFVRSLYLLATLVLMLAFVVYAAMWIMLLTARKLCYDNFGNLKNT